MPPIPEGLVAALADRYRLTRELGAGGMATVYLAEDLKHSRQVAVKVLRPDLAAALGADRFVREVGIAARLSHPHIVGLLDSGEAAGFLYYVMPYVEGTSLRQKLQGEGELPVPEAVRILRDVADALAYAHRRGVVHRDIKPENIMLVERHALVMDFGVAKAVAAGRETSGTSGLSSAGTALGTPAYMAPEQAAGDAHVDHRADLYAWGIVAYELLAGQPPFVRSTPQKTLGAQMTATPEPVSHHRANVPGPLAHLVMQCLEKEGADRPQSAEEVLRQLDLVLTPSGVVTPTNMRRYQTAAWRARRQRVQAGAATLVGLAAIAGLGWHWWQGRGVPLAPARVVIAPWRNESGQAALAELMWRLAEAASGVVTREGVTGPVPLATVREEVDPTVAVTTSALKRLSRQTGAGLVVSGSYRTRGDSVEVRTELLRMPEGAPVYGLAVITGGASDPALLERVGQQVALALQLNRDWGDEVAWGREYELPPSLPAYRAFVQAVEDSGSGACDRAMALAPTWPRLITRCGDDSALVALETRSDLLPGDRDDAAGRLAAARGQWERAYQIYHRRVAVAPATYSAAAARWAYLTGRLTEAVGYSRFLEAASFWNAPGRGGGASLRGTVASAHHLLGQYQDELRVAQDIRDRDPQVPGRALEQEITALVGLGDLSAVERLVAESELAEPRGEWLVGVALSLSDIAGRDLAAHGQLQAARRMFERAAAWHQQRMAAGDSSTDRLDGLALALLYAGRYNEARRAAAALAALGPSDTLPDRPAVWQRWALWYDGMSAAGLGDRDGALAVIGRLDSVPRLPPHLEYQQSIRYLKATIYAALGEVAQAMPLLLDAFAEGELLSPRGRHLSPELAPVRDLPAFRRMVDKVR